MTQPRKPASLSEADEQVINWVQAILPGSEPLLTPPTMPADHAAIHLYLLALAAAPPLRGSNPVPLQLMARYLVMAWDPKPNQAHALVNALVFNAMRHPFFEVDFIPSPLELWSAFQIMPQPTFVLCVPVVVLESIPPVPIVREPAVVTGVPLGTLRGVLLGPGDLPLANARVEYPALQRTVTTNAQGEFVLHAIPAEPRTKALHIKTKGNTFEMTVEQPTSPEGVVAIHIPLLD